MPIYEYQCTECKHVFDELQKMSDDPLKDCPDCGKTSLRKLVSAPNFRLKGGGWYETDFKSGNKRNLTSDSSDSSDSAATSGASDKSAADAKASSGNKDSKDSKGNKESKESKDSKGSKDSKPAAASKSSGKAAD